MFFYENFNHLVSNCEVPPGLNCLRIQSSRCYRWALYCNGLSYHQPQTINKSHPWTCWCLWPSCQSFPHDLGKLLYIPSGFSHEQILLVEFLALHSLFILACQLPQLNNFSIFFCENSGISASLIVNYWFFMLPDFVRNLQCLWDPDTISHIISQKNTPKSIKFPYPTIRFSSRGQAPPLSYSPWSFQYVLAKSCSSFKV